jgi:hypothetical protein
VIVGLLWPTKLSQTESWILTDLLRAREQDEMSDRHSQCLTIVRQINITQNGVRNYVNGCSIASDEKVSGVIVG